MKKNLLTILILATNIVTLAMVGIMMFSVMGNVNQATAFINDIAAAYELETSGGVGGAGVDPMTVNQNVAIADIGRYQVNGGEAITVTLTISSAENGGDGRQHYAQITAELLMDMTNENYAANEPLLSGMDTSIQTKIDEVVRKYTYETVMTNQDTIKQEILSALWEMFGGQTGTFIYNMNLRITPA